MTRARPPKISQTTFSTNRMSSTMPAPAAERIRDDPGCLADRVAWLRIRAEQEELGRAVGGVTGLLRLPVRWVMGLVVLALLRSVADMCVGRQRIATNTWSSPLCQTGVAVRKPAVRNRSACS